MVNSIFGTDGIRGRCLIDDLYLAKLGNLNVSLIISAIINSYPELKLVIIASDTRETCPKIAKIILHHCAKRQIKVINLGIMPTSAVSCLTKFYKADLGIMISASHNSYIDNGIKVFNSEGRKIDTADEQKISESYYKLARSSSDNVKSSNNIKKEEIKSINNTADSSVKQQDHITNYLDQIFNKFNFDTLSKKYGSNSRRKFKIVIDAAHGAFSNIIDKAFSKFDHEVLIINDQPDGRNINDNCGSLHPKDLSLKVIEVSADFGIGFDGDGDRVILVSEAGQVIDGDNLLACLAVYLTDKGRLMKNAVVVSQLANGALSDFLATKSIKVIYEEVGDKLILARMLKEGINFGGEPSGHVIISDYLQASDGLLITLLIIEMLLFYNSEVSNLANCFQPQPSILYSHPIDDSLMANLSQAIDNINNFTKTITDARFLVRKSGTEAKLRILIESRNQKKNQKYLDRIKELLKNES